MMMIEEKILKELTKQKSTISTNAKDWALEIYAERTERFEPPMWEDFEDYFFIFVNRAKDGYILWKFEVIKEKHANSSISIWNDEYELYVADATKENYEKACEIVRDLFKGDRT